jgi:hypothetical protein
MSCYKYETGHYLRTRHVGACDGEMCSGCEPCTDHHCNCRQNTHLQDGEQICAKCVGKIRADLNDIERLMAAMPTEATHRGIDSEAANLIGPAADPEAWSWRKVSAMQGRKDHISTIEDDDPHHPKTVLGTWERMIREDYEQPTNLYWTLSRCIDYLAGKLTTLARNPDQDITLLAREIRQCRAHLESVLHDQGMGDPANVGCFECGGSLERRLTTTGFEDHWTCKQCRRRYTYAEYNFALRAALEGQIA